MTTEDLYLYRVTEIIKVVDGDTIDLRLSLGFGLTAALRIRLAGVNAYEMFGARAEPRGKEAAAFVSAWLDERGNGRTDTTGLYVRTYKTSQSTVGIGDGAFGRWAADVLDVLPGELIDNAVSLGDALVEAGLAERSTG